ncbi:Hpt domain-containing protein [Aquamicrobium sp. LC103]|uniref:Hpt domain-containing protein n=1 Tax=Aquamicrobium sp. LC103 TaxID=1120658 RepID=UPI00063EB8ED|nr:Hpt domain-containing protein [Aquamicrobium sp. LC103]TKT76866.1 Hpt domain-containing protein [Aquamicrobium sp. LC103]
MSEKRDEGMAFDRPGGESCGSSGTRAIDLAHLARQTLNDRAIEQEVLDMFVHQLVTIKARIVEATSEERQALAHGLKGAARGIGAFAVADCAGLIEARPDDQTLPPRLNVLIDEVRDFIAAISR